MNKAEELKKITENYWASSEVMQKIENVYQIAIKNCENAAKRGLSSCYITQPLSIPGLSHMVIDKLKSEGFDVYWDNYIDEWVISW